MTTANKITIARILFVPFFAVLVLYYGDTGSEIYRLGALLLFAVASISDGIDGYLARHYNQKSKLGAVLDPLADKLLLVCGLVILTFDNRPYLEPLPLWLTVTVFSRDLLLLIGLVVIYYSCGAVRVRPHFVGKIATVLQMTCVIWALLKWDAEWLIIWSFGAATATIISAVIYIRSGVKQLSASPSSVASHATKTGEGR
ncbi:MAG: CDP-alcohol phosphatidyltransferase family protein [Verrucomicrobia bacterium]|nr:CDP-alcohol phosphatidyltransferase family protein [Verrucomicrobiota bacterium]MCF7707788.1 CDP-alcohol phosphatidyltransferase family protein [Verrucomicrobiota bacterium]